MVAQSSVEASLTIMLTVPFWRGGVSEPTGLEPNPQPTASTGITATTNPNMGEETLEHIGVLLARPGGLLRNLPHQNLLPPGRPSGGPEEPGGACLSTEHEASHR